MAISLGQLEYLKDYKVGKIFLPLQGGRRLRLECVGRAINSAALVAEFIAGQLPVRELDLQGKCLLFFDVGGVPFSISAAIEKIKNDRQLTLNAVEPVTHRQKREYFRVDAAMPVSSSACAGGEDAAPESALTGNSVNISACGILVLFSQPLPIRQRMSLRIVLPEPQDYTVDCQGTVVRCDKTGAAGKYMVSFHFDEIELEDQDKIIAFCLAQQRRQLSLKVQVLGPS